MPARMGALGILPGCLTKGPGRTEGSARGPPDVHVESSLRLRGHPLRPSLTHRSLPIPPKSRRVQHRCAQRRCCRLHRLALTAHPPRPQAPGLHLRCAKPAGAQEAGTFRKASPGFSMPARTAAPAAGGVGRRWLSLDWPSSRGLLCGTGGPVRTDGPAQSLGHLSRASIA